MRRSLLNHSVQNIGKSQAEIRVIKTIIRKMRREGETFKRIASFLNQAKIPTARGRRWTLQNLYRVFRCEA